MVYPLTNEIELQALFGDGGPGPNDVLLRLLGKDAKTADLAQRSVVLAFFPKRRSKIMFGTGPPALDKACSSILLVIGYSICMDHRKREQADEELSAAVSIIIIRQLPFFKITVAW